MNLYELLPSILKHKDGLAVSKTGLSTEEGTIEKIFYAIEQEFDTSADFIAGLKELVDADNVDVQYLPYLSRYLGVGFVASWPEDRKRLFIRSLVKFYFDSGQHELWKALLRFSGFSEPTIIELWKDRIYATGGYTQELDDDYYTTEYHAARVDLFLGHSGPISVINPSTGLPVFLDVSTGLMKQSGVLYTGVISVVDTSTGTPVVLNVVAGFLKTLGDVLYNGSITVTDSYNGTPVFLDVQEGVSKSIEGISQDAADLIDKFRPIHVLIRTQDAQTEIEDSVISLDSDVIAPGAGMSVEEELAEVSDVCVSSCESACEAFCEAGSCEGTFELTITCAVSCEASCQSVCEASCQTGCEAACETGIEIP